MRRSAWGFTMVELLIVMVVMTILLTLGVVSLGNLQGQARDKEREQKASIIARGLELRYNNGNSTITSSTAPQIEGKAGTYPSLAEVRHINGTPSTICTIAPSTVTEYRTKAYPGTTTSSFLNPSGTLAFNYSGTANCTANSESPNTSPTLSDEILYQPIDSAGRICRINTSTAPCVSFNLYWKSEIDSSVKTVKSKHLQ